LQSYIHEDNKPGNTELRVHVWHTSLVDPDVIRRSPAHDHRFDLTSHVLVGDLIHVEYRVLPSPKGAYRIFDIANVRRQTGIPKHDVQPSDGLPYDATLHPLLIKHGNLYTFPKREFHMTRTTGMAVTLVCKKNQEDTCARILSDDPEGAMNGFSRQQTREQYQPILDEAAARLLFHGGGW
jgi:hypothetical protein